MMGSNKDSTVDIAGRASLRNLKAAEPKSDSQSPDTLEIVHSGLPVSGTDSISTPSSKLVSSNAGSSSTSSSPNVDWLVSRVHQLEEKLAKALRISDAPEGNKRRLSAPDAVEPAEGFVAKSRFFGHTHWIYGMSMVSIIQ
jgi:hypothetical protein